MTWEAVIGLEVHAQLATRTKIFCGCPTTFGARPNENVCPVCLGMPGCLPVLNREAVRLGVRAALALGGTVVERSQFARKNYFYPDLPKGYQISQYDQPLALGGEVVVDTEAGRRTVRLIRLHLEEDAGKSVHAVGRAVSLVDCNRAGVPLAEIVSEPDLRSPDEASAYLKELRAILRYTGVSDGNMEEGSFRCDANVSVRRAGDERLGTRTEIKNMNSFRHVRQALEWEVRRQSGVLDDGGVVAQETRLWDPDRGVTEPMRSKEEAHDYRYFPDPDLPPLVVDGALVEAERAGLPELPAARRARYTAELGLPDYDAGVLTAERETADYFEGALAAGADPKEASNWVMTRVLATAGRLGCAVGDLGVTPGRLAALIVLVEEGTVSRSAARKVFEAVAESGEEPAAAVARLGLRQESDEGTVRAQVAVVVAAHAAERDRYRAGDRKLLGFFMGQVMRALQGRGDPAAVRAALQQELDE